jgi:hypothetical protein
LGFLAYSFSTAKGIPSVRIIKTFWRRLTYVVLRQHRLKPFGDLRKLKVVSTT